MEVSSILCIRSEQATQWCVYTHHWAGLPVFVTKDERDSRSALYGDGTSLIILGSALVKTRNTKFIYNRLWHEVAHLYFKDVWKQWDLSHEFRADFVSSAAMGREITIHRLCQLKDNSTNSDAIRLIGKRIDNLRCAAIPYSKADVFRMLEDLRPVTVTHMARGNQYI